MASVSIFGAGQYAMRCWVNPDKLANLGITVPEIVNAIRSQNNVNPAGQIGGEPVPPGPAIHLHGARSRPAAFGRRVWRDHRTAQSGGGILRLKDVARMELGAQNYSIIGRLNGQPAALIAVYQSPGSNAVATAAAVRKVMEEAKTRFPQGLDYVVALDTTLAVTSGIKEIEHTILEALVLVTLVVFIFLQGWRATLIPLLAVPVSLIGTFILFPLLGFSINSLSLFGLVLAVGLVVDDAIVVVEAVEHHIEKGKSPRDAALQAMEEVSGPVIAIALILAAVFIPTAFIPGITGRLYQQFAVTIAVSVSSLGLQRVVASARHWRPCCFAPGRKCRGPLGAFFRGFNRVFGKSTDGYVGTCRHLIHKSWLAFLLLGVLILGAVFFGGKVPGSFLPDEDQGFLFVGLQLPSAASLQRTSAASKR